MSMVRESLRLLFPHGEFRARVLLALVRYHWFIRFRWLFAGAALVLLLLARLHPVALHRPLAVAVCIVVLAGINVLWTVVGGHLSKEFRGDGTATPDVLGRVVLFANAQMTVDLLILTVILRYSGGIESPMAVFYLFHVVIAALLLRPFNALLQGAWAMLLYGGLAVGECVGWISPHYPFMDLGAGASPHADWAFVVAGIGTLGIGVFGAVYFTLQIGSRLDEQERELEQANEALQTSKAAIETIQGRRARFMQTAAHQLKSPLTGIEMLAGLIRDGVVDQERVAGVVERIVSRCREAMVQVRELLTLARVQDAAPARLSPAGTEVDKVVERVVGQFSDQAVAKDLTVHVATAGCRGLSAAVDERDLEDCVTNLLENAIKYTPSGGSIWVDAGSDSEAISVWVKDTGMGIAEDAVDDIFDPFRRGNLALAANIPGSGLGLAIVREVVERANGRIEVNSTVGEGSEFRVWFPRRDERGNAPGIRDERTTVLGNRA